MDQMLIFSRAPQFSVNGAIFSTHSHSIVPGAGLFRAMYDYSCLFVTHSPIAACNYITFIMSNKSTRHMLVVKKTHDDKSTLHSAKH
jgi:hypothetical protein